MQRNKTINLCKRQCHIGLGRGYVTDNLWMKLRCYSENRIGRAWLKKERGGELKITSGVEFDDARLLRLKSLKEEFVG